MRLISKLLTALVMAGALAGAAPARAVPIYSTFGPGDSYSGAFAYGIGTGPSGDQIAAKFVPGFDSTLDSIRVAVGHFDDVNTSTFSVTLALDSAGLPGAALETFAGLAFPTPDIAIITLNSVLNPLLNAGSVYWVIVAAEGLDSHGGWALNNQGISGIAFREGGPWTTFLNDTPAFDVSGTATDVPEPSTIAVIGAGLLGLYAVRRRRRTRRRSSSRKLRGRPL